MRVEALDRLEPPRLPFLAVGLGPHDGRPIRREHEARACIGDYIEAAPVSGHRYSAFVDPSGGSADSFTMGISHREGERIYIDATREIQPPFSPEAVINEFAALCKSYRVRTIVGDKYAGEFPREQFRKRGIEYRCSDKTKSDLFRDLLPLLNAGRIVLPKSDRLVNQICGLERRVARSGKDSIDHSPGSHDDLANAVAGAAEYASARHEQQFTRVFTQDGREITGMDRHGNIRFGVNRPHPLDGPIETGDLRGGYATSR